MLMTTLKMEKCLCECSLICITLVIVLELIVVIERLRNFAPEKNLLSLMFLCNVEYYELLNRGEPYTLHPMR